MSSVGVIEVLIALRMQFIRKINAPFCTILHQMFSSSGQLQCVMLYGNTGIMKKSTALLLAANVSGLGNTADCLKVGLHELEQLHAELNNECNRHLFSAPHSQTQMAERFLESTKGCHEPTTK